MPLTQKQLTEKLEAWEKEKRKADKIEADREHQLATLIDTFEKKAEPINIDADRKLEPIAEKMQTLEAEIRAELLGRIAADGTIPIGQLETKFALATVHTDKKREIPSAGFLRAVPPRLRNSPQFAECLTVLVGRAEKFVDAATLARLVRLKLTHSVSLTLKTE